MIYSAAANAVVYQHDYPQQVVASIAGARVLGAQHVAVPATLFNLQLARVLGLSVPEIMDISGYDWPGRFPPYAHQRHMANFQALHPRCFNLSDMGTMKTLASLWAADFLMQQGVVKKAVVLSKLSTLKRVWEKEIFQHFLGRRTAVVLHGDRARREKLLREDHDFYIINHEGLGVGARRAVGHRPFYLGPLAEEIRARDDINLIIMDEASVYKDAGTLRFRIARQAVADKPYIWLLSGTPTPNAPTDAYALAKMLDKITENFRSFRDRVMYPATQFKWLPRIGANEIVHQTLQPSIRYSLDECVDLPECVVETRDVEMSPTQKTAYDTMKKELALTLKTGGQITAINEAVLRIKLIQIACGAVYGPGREIHKTDAAPRIDALKEVINEAGGKILVFAPLTSVVDLLYGELKREYGEKAVARIYGATLQGQRAQVFQDFETQAEPRIIVADPGTMSHGLTLVAANTVVWYGPTERPEIYDQANARINRPGQKRKMLVVRLASTAIEREIYKRLHEKQSMQGAILQLAEEAR